jgi:hypothetical protein
MNINIKPTVIHAPDYHYFSDYEGIFRDFDIKINSYEIRADGYAAIFWPEGAEDELFEFIFTNEEVWEELINEE